MISVFNDFDAFHFKAPDLGFWLEILLFPIYTEKRLWDSDSFGTDPLRVGSDLLGNAPICPRGTPIGSDWAFWGLFRAIWPRRRPSQQTLPLPAESVPSGYSSAQNVDLYKKFYIADFLRKRVRMGAKSRSGRIDRCRSVEETARYALPHCPRARSQAGAGLEPISWTRPH